MPDNDQRSRAARAAAESALVRVVQQYDTRPEFVVLGGLVPEWLCSTSRLLHAGTTDIDVQVDLEIACGAVNAPRLERALRNAGFEPDAERVWRWRAEGPIATVVKFELLSDLEDVATGETVKFENCEALGAANLRGTRFASLDVTVRSIHARSGNIEMVVEVNFAGLAGFLLAKCAAAQSRRKPKDWYDIAFVLLHNDAGGPESAAEAVLSSFRGELPEIQTALNDLAANFADHDAQGPLAYSQQMVVDHPALNRVQLSADAVIAVESFCKLLKIGS